MTISKELFYTNEMVARNYNHLSKEDKDRFDQMKVLSNGNVYDNGIVRLYRSNYSPYNRSRPDLFYNIAVYGANF